MTKNLDGPNCPPKNIKCDIDKNHKQSPVFRGEKLQLNKKGSSTRAACQIRANNEDISTAGCQLQKELRKQLVFWSFEKKKTLSLQKKC